MSETKDNSEKQLQREAGSTGHHTVGCYLGDEPHSADCEVGGLTNEPADAAPPADEGRCEHCGRNRDALVHRLNGQYAGDSDLGHPFIPAAPPVDEGWGCHTLLAELVTIVRGECPSLLNEDSGGDAELSLRIDAALATRPASNSSKIPNSSPASDAGTFLDIVFDGPPGHESGRFVEVEDPQGKSVRVGEWIDAGEFWRLRIPMPTPVSDARRKAHEALDAWLDAIAARDVSVALHASNTVTDVVLAAIRSAARAGQEEK